MFIEIIPLDVSIDNMWLTYFIQDKLKNNINIWSIVSIPIKNNIKYWIVSKILDLNIDENENNIKSIIDVVCYNPVLDEYQIKLIYYLSSKYFVQIHKILNIFLPKFIFNFLLKKSFKNINNQDDFIKINKNNNIISLIYNIKNKNIIEIIENILKKIDDCVLVFPDDYSVFYFLENNKDFTKNAIIYKNSFTYNAKAKIFLEIFNKTKNIIIWTRKILQYNLKKYNNIIYIEDIFIKYNFSYIHKYKNIDIFDNLIKYWNFNWFIISTIPDITSIYKTRFKNYKLINY